MAYVRTVNTASGAMAVQIVRSSRRGSREIKHLGSAHDEAGLDLLKATSRPSTASRGPGRADLGLAGGAGSPLPVLASRMGCLADALQKVEKPA